VWLVLAGRGFGKTRTGAEWVIEQARTHPRGALVAPTGADVRDIMVEGESGVMACAPPHFRPSYEPSKRRLTFPNGSLVTTYSADEPDRLRGPQHHYAWVDEWAAMRQAQTMLDMLLLGLRLGPDPRAVFTTTPRPTKAMRALIADPRTAITRGSTYDNLPNLAPTFRESVLARYEGTRLGRQELMGEILEDIEGALFRPEWRSTISERPAASRVVVGVDPAATHGPDSDETGIIVAQADEGMPTFTVLSDRSGRWTPDEWARLVAHEAERWEATGIVAERNQGGEMVRRVLALVPQPCPVTLVHASRGKQVRAEPIAALYEQGRVRHLAGEPLGALEEQLDSWVPGLAESPDRLDALVYALSSLSGRGAGLAPVRSFGT
jgi:phage terminase large subunit-like protein